MKNPPDLIVDEFERQLDEGLAPVRHPRGRAPHDPPEQAEHHRAHDSRGHHRIDIDRPEATVLRSLGEEREVVLDVIRGVEVFFGGHC